MSKQSFKSWYKSGEPGIWMSGGAVAIAVIMTIGLMAVIAVGDCDRAWLEEQIRTVFCALPAVADARPRPA